MERNTNMKKLTKEEMIKEILQFMEYYFKTDKEDINTIYKDYKKNFKKEIKEMKENS